MSFGEARLDLKCLGILPRLLVAVYELPICYALNVFAAAQPVMQVTAAFACSETVPVCVKFLQPFLTSIKSQNEN